MSQDNFTLAAPSLEDDHFHEECAVYGVYGISDAAAHVALGLHALQHRGQEACGIVSVDQGEFFIHRSLGQVGRVFGSDSAMVEQLKGDAAIGHNRYATTGESSLRNVQPLFADLDVGGVAIAHNGNITNALTLRREFVNQGRLFQSTSDTEIILHLIAAAKGTIVERLIDSLKRLEGAWSLVCQSRSRLIGVRDPHGFRPLVLGRLGKGWILSSETCGLDIIGAEYVRDIEPGEVVVIEASGITSLKPWHQTQRRHFCIFEYVYFSRPDSVVEGRSVYEARRLIGQQLAKEAYQEADIVVPIPDSGVPSALGYAEQSGLPFQFGIIRNHYVGRTFIEPTDNIRHLGVRLKHNANRHILEGKRVILVDDSVVRGTTSKKIVTMVRQAGAREVHLRIASPPTINSCYFGVDTPKRQDLLAANHSLEEMNQQIGTDSLAFVSIDGLYRALGYQARSPHPDQRGFCDACFSSEYPINLHDLNSKEADSRQLSLLRNLG